MKRNLSQKKDSFGTRVKRDWMRNRTLYLLVIPVLLFYVLFVYKPMYGTLIAFKDYRPAIGFMDSPWVGLENFVRFFNGIHFERLLRNTITLSFYILLFGFPAPIILALLLNEVKNERFKRFAQTITYMPHFISMVVVVGMITNFCMSTGVVNDVIKFFGGEAIPLMQEPKYYRLIYVLSSVWQEIGWGSIIYLSALSNVDMQLYEAASIDGAGKWKKLIHVTFPAISPTVVIMLIMSIGNMMTIGYQKTILLYNAATYEKADIIASYVYRVGILDQDWSYATAIGLFNSVINLVLIVMANKVSRKLTETSLW